MPSSIETSPTFKNVVESALISRFSDRIQALDESLVSQIHSAEPLSFGSTYSAMLVYCNGRHQSSTDSLFPRGLWYSAPDCQFGLAQFTSATGVNALHIVAPQGSYVERSARQVAEFVTKNFPDLSILIRHVSECQKWHFSGSRRWAPVEDVDWLPSAPQEDETYSHRLIDLDALIDMEHPDNPVRSLGTTLPRSCRRKTRDAHARFSNFLNRNNATYQQIQYKSQLQEQARRVVTGFFQDRAKSEGFFGSKAWDYYNLIDFCPPETDTRFFYQVGYIQREGYKLPVSFFAAERIDAHSVGCYATITRRNPNALPVSWNTTGFSAISQYAILTFLQSLSSVGIKEADLGGSETYDLDRFKQQLGAKEHASYWFKFIG